MGRAFYKGGFEKTMNRREAGLILEAGYVASTHAPPEQMSHGAGNGSVC